MPGEQLHVHSACVRAICRPPRPASGDYNPEGALGEDNTSKYLHLGQLLMYTYRLEPNPGPRLSVRRSVRVSVSDK